MKSINENMQNPRGDEVVTLFFLPTFRILGPLHISGTVEARNFKHVHKSVQIE